MKSRQGYKGYVIVARSCELQEGEFSAEFSVEEHEADGFMETEFYLPGTFLRRDWFGAPPPGRRMAAGEY
jgi:hypothetical protein